MARMGRPPIWTIAGDKPGKRLTILACVVGNHSGHFTITRTPLGWACDECLRKGVADDRFAEHFLQQQGRA